MTSAHDVINVDVISRNTQVLGNALRAVKKAWKRELAVGNED